MCSCHSILECYVTFSGVKLSIRSFVLFIIEILIATFSNEIPVRFTLGVLSAWHLNYAFCCNTMCWLITMKCSSAMEFSLP